MDNKTNEMQLFTNSVFGNVRAVNIDGKAWFVGKDVVESLGYKRTSYSDAIKRYCDEEDYMLLDSKTQPQNGVKFETQPQNRLEFDYKQLGQRGGYLINEYGVIQLVLQSPLEQAKQFKRWITHEVIPSVLKHGAYIDTSRTDALPYIEQQLAEMEKAHEIDERYINSLRQRVSQAVKDRNDAWKVQSDRREIIDEMQKFINMLLEEKILTKDEMKQLAKIEMLRELTGNMWVTK